MADSSIFDNFYSSAVGMGNPMTPQAGAYEPWEQEALQKMSPDIAGAIILNRKREDVYNDPSRFGELLKVMKEFRAEEAAGAAKIQAERDKRAFQYNLIASIPQTINQVSSDIARMTFNAPRQQILAGIPDQIRAAYGSMPAINIPRTRGFS
jgi:hypothetical protein